MVSHVPFVAVDVQVAWIKILNYRCWFFGHIVRVAYDDVVDCLERLYCF